MEEYMQTLQEILEALRDLHDFAVCDTHYRYKKQSAEAFKRAAEILEKFGA